MIKINLLPDVVIARRRNNQIKRYATIAMIAWAALLGGLLLLSGTYRGVQAVRLKQSQDKLTNLNATINSAENQSFRREALQVQSSLSSLGSLLATQRSANEFIDSLRALVPSGSVRVQDITLNPDNTVTLAGSARSYAELGKFVLSLKDSANHPEKGNFTDVVMLGAAIGSTTSIDFTITAHYVEGSGEVSNG